MERTLNTETTALLNLYNLYNEQIFGKKLPKTVVTIQRDGGLKCTGYFTAWESWKAVDGTETATEISITAEELNRSNISIAETMLHECVHAYNYAMGVKDTSRGGAFHNKKFWKEAEARGLTVEEHKKYGCVTTGFAEKSKALTIATKWANDNSGTFEKYRYQPAKAKPTKKRAEVYKYKCPCCDAIVSSKLSTLHIRCVTCGMDFDKLD